MTRIAECLGAALLLLLPLFGVAWVLNIPELLRMPLVTQQIIAIMLGLAGGAAFLRHPYSEKPGAIEVLLALIAALSWFWFAWNFDGWMVRLASRTPDMWIPGAIAIITTVEALRKSLGNIIAALVTAVLAYGFFGDLLPGVFEAAVFKPTKTILYLYADSSGIPGLVVDIIISLVLPFVIFGKIMEAVGGMAFFNNLAIGLMGHRRGGPAKVAVVASSSFGMLSGSTVANVMSTGILTIPMMKRTGFRPAQAAAIEAVASNGGQIMPPVMGATAFIIAEFLQVPYSEVVFAGLMPALLYYLVLFSKIDAIAVRGGLAGLPRSEIPSILETLRTGWLFLVPIVLLVWLLFWRGLEPGLAALWATGILLTGYAVKKRFQIGLSEIWTLVRGAGQEIVPLILIGGGAGVVIGIMNSTGFAFQLSLMLSHVAEAYGLFWMLILAALVSIVLGMGMPTAAVYLVLVTVVAPTVVRLGVDPMGAHLFLFYFGLLSMITPPIAMGSIVAAQIANASMWSTGFYGIRLGLAAYFLPFLWVYNPAAILRGTPLEISLVIINCVAAAMLLRQSMLESVIPGVPNWLSGVALTALALGVGSSTLWLGAANPVALAPSLIGLLTLLPVFRKGATRRDAPRVSERVKLLKDEPY